MPKLATWQCHCGRYAQLECDWPLSVPTGTDGAVRHCNKPICGNCARSVDGHDYCPFHRGDLPHIAAAKAKTEEEQATEAGEREANNAARIWGIKRETK